MAATGWFVTPGDGALRLQSLLVWCNKPPWEKAAGGFDNRASFLVNLA